MSYVLDVLFYYICFFLGCTDQYKSTRYMFVSGMVIGTIYLSVVYSVTPVVTCVRNVVGSSCVVTFQQGGLF